MGLILTQNVTKCRLATKAGEAMFFDEVVDFSAYAGGVNQIWFKDSGGKYAKAYGATVGGGEALGADALASLDITLWLATNATRNDANTFTLTAASGGVYKSGILEDGRLYKTALNGTVSAGTLVLRSYNGGLEYSNNGGSNIYRTCWNNAANYNLLMFYNSSGGIGATNDINSASIPYLTDIPVTGLRLVSAYGGATRNMLSVEAGFLPNSITTVYVYSVGGGKGFDKMDLGMSL